MTLAARYAEAMLDADNLLLRDHTFYLCGLDSTDLLTLYTDETKQTVASAVGTTVTDDDGNLAVWMDDRPFDLYSGGNIVGSVLVGGVRWFRGLVPVAYPGEERSPVRYEFTLPTNPWVINHGRDYDPLITCKDTTGRVFQGGITYAPGIVTVDFASNQTGTAELT